MSPWFSTTHAGRDREDGRPIIRVFCKPGHIGAALAWVEAMGWEWQGWRISASNEPGEMSQ